MSLALFLALGAAGLGNLGAAGLGDFEAAGSGNLGGAGASPQQGPGGLFAPAPASGQAERAQAAGAQAAPAQARHPEIVRSRRVTIDPAFLRASRPEDLASGWPALLLNLFDDASFTAVLDRVDRGAGGLAWVGHVAGVDLSTVTLSAVNGVLAGSIAMPGAVYAIRYVGGAEHEVAQIDQSRLPREAEPIPVSAPERDDLGAAQGSPAPSPNADTGSPTIDVMVLYTPAATSSAGGASAITALINLGISETNTSYANSNISQRLQLVHSQEVAYTEAADMESDLYNVSNHDTGGTISTPLGNTAAALRNTYGADLVMLVTSTASLSYCGMGWFMQSVSSGFAAYAFSVVDRSCVSPSYSFAHELGHNMGANHDWYVANDTVPYTYAHGYVNTTSRWLTIMSYHNLCQDQGLSCTRLLYWSNPAITYNSAPMGIPAGTKSNCPTGNVSNVSCDADNHSVLNNTAATVAGFRQAAGTRIISLSGDLAFGNVTAGTAATRTLTISNSGSSTLTVSGISYPAGFSGAWSGTVGAGGSQPVTVTFAPLAVTSYGGTVTVTANQTSGTNTMAASGTGTMPLPAGFAKTGPANGATGQPASLTLTWEAASGAASYEYCLDTTNDNVCATTWTSAGTSTSAAIAGLTASTTYFWQVRAANAGGATEANGGTWWSLTTQAATRQSRGDFDGDARVDVAVFRPSTGEWWGLLSSHAYAWQPGYLHTYWGAAGDVPLSGDYDGDGKGDLVTFRPATAEWRGLLSTDNYDAKAGYLHAYWGMPGDEPVPGDYDGDGKGDLVLFRPATGEWWGLLSSFNYDCQLGCLHAYWGLAGDVPVPGDYDGDGRNDLMVFRPTTGEWWGLLSSHNYTWQPGYVHAYWGLAGDEPVPGDYDGDGKSDLVVFRTTTGVWWGVLSSKNYDWHGGYLLAAWGNPGDLPVPGDYDGDMRADLMVFRPATAQWWGALSGKNYDWHAGYLLVSWGITGDVPVSR